MKHFTVNMSRQKKKTWVESGSISTVHRAIHTLSFGSNMNTGRCSKVCASCMEHSSNELSPHKQALSWHTGLSLTSDSSYNCESVDQDCLTNRHWRKNQGGWGGSCPPSQKSGGAEPPQLTLHTVHTLWQEKLNIWKHKSLTNSLDLKSIANNF